MRFVFIAIAVFFVLPKPLAHADLRRDLDKVYSSWREAIAARNLQQWQQYTAAYRQMLTRNMIVSQQQPFPDALFNVPMKPPETAPLRFVEVQTNGPTAHLVYFGKVDLGIAEINEIPDNVLILKFVKEDSGWKFDTTRLLNLEPVPNVRAALKNGGSTPYLNAPELAPSGSIPPTGRACPKPDWVGVLQIVSYGYEAKAAVNGFDVATVTDNAEEHIIIGGLRDGMNPLSLALKKVPLPPEAPKDAERIIELNAIVLTGAQRRPSIHVFQWRPEREPTDGNVNLAIHVSKITMRE